MIVSYNWLREFVDISVEADELARALVAAGLEVASIRTRAIPRGVVAARVLTVQDHPNADKLHVCTVDTGSGVQQIVCGAPNVRPDLLVACATIGTDLGDGFIIKKAKLRGVESLGMLCSERELKLSEEHAGIMELPQEVEVGKPMATWFPDDTLLELEITPDRGDCLSILGVAREVACAFSKPLLSPALTPRESADSIESAVTITVSAPDRCPRYLGRLVRNVTVGPSPLWLRDRLASAGVRSINNIVDITNYVLFGWGQPMHAFDFDRLSGSQINVRSAAQRESFTTLDGVARTLTGDDLLICDAQQAVALAGVMGGLNSQISESTTNVFLECAYFDQVGIRVTARRQGLSSASSYRFERGVDPAGGLELAIDTAAELLRTLANGTVASGRIDVCNRSLKPRTVPLRPERARRLLGADIKTEFMVESLGRLGMACSAVNESTLDFSVPLYRHDISMEVDLIEEVGRLHGYDNIPLRQFCRVPVAGQINPSEQKLQRIRTALAHAGLNEIVTNSMTSQKSGAAVSPGIKPVVLLNPLNPDMAQLRTSMAGSHLTTVAHNVNRRNLSCRFFETGKVFEALDGTQLPRERTILAITLCGPFKQGDWQGPALDSSFSLLKGIIESLAESARLGKTMFSLIDSSAPYWLDPQQGALLSTPAGIRGVLGRVHTRSTTPFGIAQPVYCAELDITDFLAHPSVLPSYKPITRYPALERDFCFVMDESFVSGVLEDHIRKLSPLIALVRPFDIYRGENLGAGKKSIAYSVRLESGERTLGDTDADSVCSTIIDTVKETFGIVLR